MDLKGLKERLGVIEEERVRAIDVPKVEQLEEERRWNARARLRSICGTAAWTGGKGPRRVTDPIILQVQDNIRLEARVHTYDKMGEPCNYFDGSQFEVKVYQADLSTNASTMVAVQAAYDSDFQYHLDDIEQTVIMLNAAVTNPELNPKFQERLAAQS